MIKLRPIKVEDVTEIKNWPAYVDGFEQMDYAVRENGWLDEFRKRTDAWIFIAELNEQVVGFSLLAATSENEAEFRIAIRPHLTGKGLGRKVTLATLNVGFRQLNLDRIDLIVRKNNPRAARLYECIGFVKTGESVHIIQGKRIEFTNMVMTKEKFSNLKGGESS